MQTPTLIARLQQASRFLVFILLLCKEALEGGLAFTLVRLPRGMRFLVIIKNLCEFRSSRRIEHLLNEATGFLRD